MTMSGGLALDTCTAAAPSVSRLYGGKHAACTLGYPGLTYCTSACVVLLLQKRKSWMDAFVTVPGAHLSTYVRAWRRSLAPLRACELICTYVLHIQARWP